MCNFVVSEIMLNYDYGGVGEYYWWDFVDGVNGLFFYLWRFNVEDMVMSFVYDFIR